MILAVFARGLDRLPTGRGLVARNLTLALRRVRPDIQIHLFASADPGWPDVHFHLAKGVNAISDVWRMATGVAREVNQIRPDLLWCATHLLPGGLPKSLPKVITLLDVVWKDCPQTMSWQKRYNAAYGERGLAMADRIVCISAFTRARLSHYWPDLEPRARLMYLAPSVSAAVSQTAPANSGDRFVLNVDTIEPRKNLDVLLDAMPRLSGTRFVQCGAVGWKVKRLLKRASSMPNVQLLGYTSDHDIRRLYESAAVAVFPSTYEGFHIPPLDAMTLGCPVVASDIPAHREILGSAAVYFSAVNSSALATAVESVMSDCALRSRLIEAGRIQAARYSWDSSAKILGDIFDEVMDA